MADIFSNINELIPKLYKQIELYQELKRALRLAELLGVSPKEMKGKVRAGVIDGRSGPRYDPQPWRGAIFHVTYNGVDHKFPLTKVHKDLWPEEHLRAWERHQKRLGAAPNKQGD